MTAAEIAGMPHQEISVDDHGKTVRFEGVPLRLVLEKAGVTLARRCVASAWLLAFWWRPLNWIRDSRIE
jgi:hypothetical protein